MSRPKVIKVYTIYTGARFARVEWPDGYVTDVRVRGKYHSRSDALAGVPLDENAWGDPFPLEETRRHMIVAKAIELRGTA